MDSDDRRLCVECIGEDYVCRLIIAGGALKVCDYCGRLAETETLEALADQLEGVFKAHMRRTPTDPVGYEVALAAEDGFERRGDPTAQAIANLLGIDEAPANDLQALLSERHWDIERAKMGEESEFDAQAHYEESRINDLEFQLGWRAFEAGLQTRGRFFNRAAEAVLAELFDGVEGHATHDGRRVVCDIGPGSDIESLHRARVFQASAPLEAALTAPESLIGSPASAFASAGRMNARGISVFYGATDPKLALAEVRPPVGSRVIVGRFDILRPLRVLDVEALENLYVDGSLFDPAFGRRLELAKFLERLANRIRMPVMPNDEATDYLATQAMAEYLADRLDPGLDGVVYGSAQGVAGAFNVVLFHHAAMVEPGPPHVGAVDVWHPQAEDAVFPAHYTVWSEPEPPVAPEAAQPATFMPLLAFFEEPVIDREPTLRLDRDSLTVRLVKAVKVCTEDFEVERRVSPGRDAPF
ncbi:RES family NAD+ phosphorylase [Caulobacter sp.]|jgi:hypothetical protein|uniref:RES family NAD+ phosphorylase n=1 Tax=Caulobacter sp. TaxID=78 RepID=UPI0031DA7B69